MFLKFSDDAQKLLLLSLKEKNKLNDFFIGTEHIFLAVLSMKNNYICKLLNECDIFYDQFYSYLEKKDNNDNDNYYIFTPLLNEIINNLSNNKTKKNNEVTISDIIIEILNSPNSKTMVILKKMNVDIRKILKNLNVSNKKKNIKKSILNDLGTNLNDKFMGSNEIVLERNDEIDMIVEILCCKNKNNPLLIGDAGVGKTAIVEELARRISTGDIPLKLKGKKIYSVAMASLVAGTKYRGEFEEKINKLVAEVEGSDDVILFIDEIHTLVGAGGADGAIDASNILKPYLARGNIKIIGATTKEEYKKYIANDKALSRRFQIVDIDEPNIDKTKKILMGTKYVYEDYHNVIIPDNIIDKIIYFSNFYIKNRKFPDKAIDILDKVCVLSSIFYNKEYNSIVNLDKEINRIVKLKNKSLINNDYKGAIKYSHIEKELQHKMGRARKNIFKNQKIIEVDDKVLFKVMERKTKIPFYTYKYNYKLINKYLNDYRNNSIFSTEIVNKICDFTSNIYLNMINNGISDSLWIRSNKYGLNNYFINNYLKSFFSNTNIINIDISNFRNIDDLLLKNDENNNKNDSFIDKIKNNSFSIIVIDNLNSADYSIKEFFDKIDKYGYYVDRNNDKIDFTNVLFIYNVLTSDSIGFNSKENIKENKFYLDIGDINTSKLKKRIKDICINNSYPYNKSLINYVYEELMIDNDKLENIEFFIRKKLLNNNINLKNKTEKIAMKI